MSSMRGERRTDTGNGVVRMVFVVLASVVQIFLLYLVMRWLTAYSAWIYIGAKITAVMVVLAIYGHHTTTSMKLPWIVLIQAAPFLGVILWALMSSKLATHPMKVRFARIEELLSGFLLQEDGVQETLRRENAGDAGMAQYLWRKGHFPLCRNEGCLYYKDAAKALEAQLEDLRKAESFIFMEYFAVEDRVSFGRIHQVLKEKAAQGVEVRLFYDDVGSIGFVNGRFCKRMEADGIKARIFNPVLPSLRVFMNNRDHRKITVIDGKVAYTGGYNLADEYFGVTRPYGEWKDAGIRVTGPAVRTFTTIFLEMWNAIHATDEDDKEFDRFFPGLTIGENGRSMQSAGEILKQAEESGTQPRNFLEELAQKNITRNEAVEKSLYDALPDAAGYVQPYADSPLDEEQIGENVYLSIANGAADYLYFVTPYLILTDEMSRAITLAAERGVDVRIITPGVPDKKITYQLTRSYYAQLIRKGVRIYEFTPGFCHAKCCVSDDRIATCGTINLDYRSLYHHFEDGCVMYGAHAVLDVRNDLEDMISRSREVTEDYSPGHRSATLRTFQCVLRLIAPLM